MHIVTQSTSLQKSATDTQQGSDQHQTTASNDASEQQSSVQQQPTPPYALLNYKPKARGVRILATIHHCTYCNTAIHTFYVHFMST